MLEGARPTQEQDTRLIVITPRSLGEDNEREAPGRIVQFLANKDLKKLRVAAGCVDARVLIPDPEKTISMRSIATAGSKEYRIIESRGVEMAIVLGHFDGETVEPEKRPTGCGGLGAKEQAINGSDESVRGIDFYIRNRVQHPDVCVQCLMTADEIAAQTGKPTLAAVQDHITAVIYPIAAFLDGGLIRASRIRDRDLIIYNQANIYRDGIPALEDDEMPGIFGEFMEASRAQARDLAMRFPTLRDMQRVQNPRMVVLSTELMSMRLRYPQTSDTPGILFKLHVPREKMGSGISIKPELLEESLGQAQYPLEHAVHNYNTDNAFSKTNRLLIETEDFNLSVQLAQSISERDWMQKWLGLEDHKIIVAQSRDGITNKIDWYPLAA